jgi:putative transposase
MPWNNRKEERKELVRAVQRRREPVRKICARFGVSRSFAYKLKARFEAAGWPGVGPRRRGPKGWSTPQAQYYQSWVLAERRGHPFWGARKLWWRLRTEHRGRRLPSGRTLERWLRKAGVVQKRSPRRRVNPQPLQTVPCSRRSNDRWTVDWKGWIRSGDGRKVEPLTVRDDATRKVLWAWPLPGRSDVAVRRVCQRLFQRYGVPRKIRTDLGGPFCGTGPHGFTSLSLWWHRLGIAVEFVNKRARIHNNAHEQMHGVLAAETGKSPAPTYRAQLVRLRKWTREYNEDRPHDALGGRTPAQCYRANPGPMPQLQTPQYPAAWPVRQVASTGSICLHGQHYYVGRACARLPVGCRPVPGGHDIYYGKLLLKSCRPPPSSADPSPRGRGR